jgi:hypothetical protein
VIYITPVFGVLLSNNDGAIALIVVAVTLARRLFLQGTTKIFSALYWGLPAATVSGLFWWWAGANNADVWGNALRTFAMVILFFSENWAKSSVLNGITLRIPLVRDIIWVASRLFATIRQHALDIVYVYAIELKRSGWIHRPRLLAAACVEAVIQTIDALERFSLVVEARGAFPPLRTWYSALPMQPKVIARDACFATAVVVAMRFYAENIIGTI